MEYLLGIIAVLALVLGIFVCIAFAIALVIFCIKK